MKKHIPTFEEFVNESQNISESITDTIDGIRITYDSKKNIFLVGGKKVDPDQLDYEWDDKSEGWLMVNATNVPGLNKKEREALEEFVSGAYNDDIKKYWDVFVNESQNINETAKNFYPNLFYVIGIPPRNSKHDFWKDAFSKKGDDGKGMKDRSQTVGNVKEMFNGEGYDNVKVVSGSVLAVMIQKGETTAKSLFEYNDVNESKMSKGG